MGYHENYSFSKHAVIEITKQCSATLLASALYCLVVTKFSDTATKSFDKLASITMIYNTIQTGIAFIYLRRRMGWR